MIQRRKCYTIPSSPPADRSSKRRPCVPAGTRYAPPMFMTHLECSLTGERYDSAKLQNLSKAGNPLLARYDREAVAERLSKEALASRPAGMWKWRELLPLPEGADPVSLGEPETPLIPLDRIGGRHRARAPIIKDEGRLPTGSFKARGMAVAVSMAKHF